MYFTSRPSAFHSLTLCRLCLLTAVGAWFVWPSEGAENESSTAESQQAELEKDVTQGALRVVKPDGAVVECPLKHTDVSAEISGFVARVRVKQTFHNPLQEKIEAVYVFPLPHEAAVDDMTMSVGERKIVGIIKRRAEARQIYEQALLAGQTAAILEQERPNIFTQSVGNIAPGQQVVIEISYVDVLEYDLGNYEFRFPMVVGPRYNPGAMTNSPGPLPPELRGKTSPASPNTDRVPDAARISPPVLKPGFRNGHDTSLTVDLDAGVPIEELTAANHKAEVKRTDERRAKIAISPNDQLPNKDFVLRYKVSGKKPELALLAHTDRTARDAVRAGAGYFMLMIQPKEDERLAKSPPREMVFLVDVSGSMSGEPTAKVIDAMQSMLKLCRPIDTVQVVTFAGEANQLFEKPVPVNPANIARALNFTQGLQGGGGTEMLKGVKLAIDEPLDKERMRIVVMLTDGYIGNEADIIEHVGKACGDRIRFWCLGIGSSPNMFLVDGVARQGGGMGRTLGLTDDAAVLTLEIMTRIQRAQLAKVKIDYGGLQITQTFPARVPELWSGRPVIVYGRYAGSGDALLTVKGEVEGEPASWTLKVRLPADEPAHDVLAKVWARQKIEDLMQQTFYQGSPAVEEEVTGLALEYKLMSQYTSFVAVDQQGEKTAGPARPPRQMLVPVPLPAGTRWEGFFGPEGEEESERLSELDNASFGLPTGSAALPMPAARVPELAKKLKSDASDKALYFRRRASLGLAAGATSMAGMRSNLGRGVQGPMAGGMPMSASGGAVRAGIRLYAERESVKRESQLFDSISVDEPPQQSISQTTWSYTAAALAEQSAELTKQAQAALDEGRKQQKDGRLSDAHVTLAHAWFLAAAAGAEQVAAEALEALEAVHADEILQAAEAQPALDKRLELVIRDQSVEAALKAVADAARVELSLLPGSLEDAAALMHVGEARARYLDLRGAKVAEALDWLLRPVRLEWRLDGDRIVVGSSRRMPGSSAWIYDVTAMALPLDDELKGTPEENAAACKRFAGEFIDVVRRQLAGDTTDLVWFSPGQLLVIGDSNGHDIAARVLAQLAGAKAQMTPELAALRKTTMRRRDVRQAENDKQAAARLRTEASQTHAHYGWQLLAAAAAGELDLEALTELQIVWKSPETADLLKGQGKSAVLRSYWALAEAGRLLKNEPDLDQLAAHVKKLCQPALAQAEETLRKSPNDAEAFVNVLYGALAERDQPTLAASRLKLLASSTESAEAFVAARELAQSLLVEPSKIDQPALEKIVRGELVGEDLVALAAFACRRAGGEAWQAFREESQRLLGNQPLPGSLVVLIGRLDSLPPAN